MLVTGSLLFILWLFYAILIGYYWKGWSRQPLFELPPVRQLPTFSVIIAARNEAANIGPLLESLLAQDYPRSHYEIILVDDHSTDETARIAAGYPGVTIIRLTADGINSYKKKAIETGIAAAANTWIVCTDADCLLPSGWLTAYAGFIEARDPVFIAAPVRFVDPLAASGRQRASLLFVFQTLDFMTLQGITGASVYRQLHGMCNGANLAYRRVAFEQVEGFKGIDGLASGDDMFLMHKFWKKFPGRVQYLKSPQVVVDTAASPDWKSFLQQRIRWASKAGSYEDKRIFAVLAWVYLFNLSFLILLIAGFFNSCFLWWLLALWVLKTAVEYPFVRSVSRFFGQQKWMRYFFIFQPLHIAYTLIAGFLGVFGSYEWKGRRVK